MKYVIVGTAGHIDHGKTRMVKALTGVDTDRLPEEKARGITIDLGFAHMELPDGTLCAFVDVPGHERFVRNMVAGAQGIDMVLLVVAADEGVMPQTREHLDICKLLGVARGLVVLSKVDLVEPEWLGLVREDLALALRGTFLEGAEVISFSAATGQGLDELRQALVRVAAEAQPRARGGLARLPVDRVFSMRGFGTVVTGTLQSGRLEVGQEVEFQPGGQASRIRGLQVHGLDVEEALAGRRIAMNVTGLEKGDIERGSVVVPKGTIRAGRMFDIRLTLLPVAKEPLKGRGRFLFHVGTTAVLAEVVLVDRDVLVPGEEALAQTRLEGPVVATAGDRFILRGFRTLANYGKTVGGGQVLGPSPRRRRRSSPRDREVLEVYAYQGPAERVAMAVQEAAIGGISYQELQNRLPLSARELERTVQGLLSSHELIRFDADRGTLIHSQVVRDLEARLLDQVREFHQAYPARRGVPKEELRTRVARGLDPKLFQLLLLRLGERLTVEQDVVRQREHRAGAGVEEMKRKIDDLYARSGLEPPWRSDLPEALGEAKEMVQDAVALLLKEGVLVRIKDNLLFHRDAIDGLRQRLVAHLRERGQISTQEFKEMASTTRKYSIPLGEYFDASRVTMRVGEVRVLRKGYGEV